jgi:ABC-type branched-subunit amino acid transport system substrate-binding protein
MLVSPKTCGRFRSSSLPNYEFYQDLIEYNGAACETPDPNLKDLSEIRIGFIGPLSNHPDQSLGYRMLKGASLAIDEANAAGGYAGKPFKLMLRGTGS